MNEILIYGDIGFEVEPAAIVAQLKECDGAVDVRVDSYGGDVYAGISIMNALRRYQDVVTVHVDGMAASAASYIAVGGADRLVMSPNSSMMIHGAWTNGSGNAAEFTEIAANLVQITDNIAGIYAEKSGKDKEFWLDVMQKDTTYTAEQAVEIGLADEVAESQKSAHAHQKQLVMASKRSRFESGSGATDVPEIAARSTTPPVRVEDTDPMPGEGRKEERMNILNELAQELGTEPDKVRDALSGFFNETVAISGEVDVSYPADVQIVPTEKVTVEPIFGDGAEGAAGLTFEMGEVAEGYTAEVDETTGVVTVTAPSGAEVDSTADFAVNVNGSAIPLSVTVRALSTEDESTEEAAPAEPVAPESADAVTLDMETYNELKAAAQHGWKAMESEKEAKLVGEVDNWIQEGRISAGLRAKAVAAIKRDADAARDIYGSNPKNTIPRVAVGSAKAPDLSKDAAVPSLADLKKLAADRRTNK